MARTAACRAWARSRADPTPNRIDSRASDTACLVSHEPGCEGGSRGTVRVNSAHAFVLVFDVKSRVLEHSLSVIEVIFGQEFEWGDVDRLCGPRAR